MLRYSFNQIFPIAFSQNNILSSSNYFFGSNPIISRTYNAQHPISYPISNSIIANNYSFQPLPTAFQSYPASYQTVPTFFQSAPTLSYVSSYYPLNYNAYSNMAPIAINSSNFHFPSSNIIPSNNNIPHTYIQISDPKKAESSSVFDRQQNPRQIELTNSQTLKTLTREIGTQTDITCRLISDNRFPLPRAFQAIACLSNIVEEINKSQYDSPNHQQGGEYPDESPSTTTRSEDYKRMEKEYLPRLPQNQIYC